MSDKLRRVVMHQAFRWFCLDCETENFDRAVTVEFTDPDEELRIREELGLPPGELCDVVETPPTVTCRSCLAMFNTLDESADECDGCDGCDEDGDDS